MPATATIDVATGDVTATFDFAESRFGMVPNLVKVLATNPTMCSSVTAFFAQALQDGRVEWAFKELVILKTLRSIGAYYSYGAHERLATELGNSPDRIGDLAHSLWQTSPHFNDGERAVLELVTQIAEDANAVPDELWDRLRAHWDHGQLPRARRRDHHLHHDRPHGRHPGRQRATAVCRSRRLARRPHHSIVRNCSKERRPTRFREMDGIPAAFIGELTALPGGTE